MKSILVTGASGFIGKSCLKYLLDIGFVVYAVHSGRTTPPSLEKQDGQLYWYNCNLLNFKRTEVLIAQLKPTHLLHFAWYTQPGKFWDSPLNLDWLQVSINLLKVFINNGGKRFIGVGTVAEYDWSFGICDEETTSLKPNTLYGTCKESFLQILKSYAQLTNLSYAWGRIFWLYGPGEYTERLIPYVILSLLAGKIAQCSNGIQERDFLHVDDVSRAFALLADSNISGAVNIASGKAVAVRDLLMKVGEKLQRRELINLGAKETKELPLIVASVKRLSNELHFLPKYTLDSGLENTVAWWKANIQTFDKEYKT